MPSAVTFGQYQYEKTVLEQQIGRFSVDVEGIKSTVHAIGINTDSVVGALLMIPVIGEIVAKILYGAYSYKNLHGHHYLVSDQSEKGAELQAKTIRKIEAFKVQSPLYAQVPEVNALQVTLSYNKAPFRKLVQDGSKVYKVGRQLLFLDPNDTSCPQLLFQHGRMSAGAFKEVKRVINITKQKEQVVAKFKGLDRYSGLMWFLRSLGSILIQISPEREAAFYQQARERGVEHIRGIDQFLYTEEGNQIGIMEYCNGGTLKDAISTMSDEEKLQALITLAKTVADLHDAGVVHRDIKSANVLMHEGVPYLADFGCANAYSQPALKFGYQGRDYLAPEMHFRGIFSIGHFVTPTQDYWALGTVIQNVMGRKNQELNAIVSGLKDIDPYQRTTAREAYTLLTQLQSK